jgi:thiol-disulfide isomerase/thioredoxin
MSRRFAVLLSVALISSAALAGAGDFRPLRSGSFADLVAARQGQPFLLVLWSVTCAPCRQEFELLADVKKTHPGLKLLLISTDDIADRRLAGEVLGRYGLEHEPSWMFADPDAQRLRYEIDPAWYGEMPRAYFYDANHRRQAVSGSLKRAQVEDWLGTIKSP